jgi:hypothetical protein
MTERDRSILREYRISPQEKERRRGRTREEEGEGEGGAAR